MDWKAKGNDCFRIGQYTEAIDFYSKAIETDKENAVLYRYLLYRW
jgi:tetratricopeptide (TPR) repeat protein